MFFNFSEMFINVFYRVLVQNILFVTLLKISIIYLKVVKVVVL